MGVAPVPARSGHSLRLVFLGDDFTGSTDALEVLAIAGWRCALFLAPPDAATLAAHGPFDAIGVAGETRSMTCDGLRGHLPPVLEALAAMPAPLVHYKVCSTFDSSPMIGSIGAAMDLARPYFGDCLVPVVAGAPALGRYCVFGNLHARSATDGDIYRLDRHPIMSRHPVTPMGEADLALHLGAQTRARIARLTLPILAEGVEPGLRAVRAAQAEGAGAMLLDSVTTGDLMTVAQLLEFWPRAPGRPLFAIGSSGLEHALVLRAAAQTAGHAPVASLAEAGPAAQVLVVSGSASALSAAQIEAALAAGFADLPVDTARLLDDGRWRAEAEALQASALAALGAGRSLVIHGARGPRDPRIDASLAPRLARGMPRDAAMQEAGALLAARLGVVVESILRARRVPRLVLSGGDASSHVARHLAPTGFVVAATLARGAPLCRMISRAPHLDGLEIAMKGGQMGAADYFVRSLTGMRAAGSGQERMAT
jgi:uncharacterized protein YgbK (DUF1537 family)